jgi:predicted PurR-regulated permease PerM
MCVELMQILGRAIITFCAVPVLLYLILWVGSRVERGARAAIAKDAGLEG